MKLYDAKQWLFFFGLTLSVSVLAEQAATKEQLLDASKVAKQINAKAANEAEETNKANSIANRKRDLQRIEDIRQAKSDLTLAREKAKDATLEAVSIQNDRNRKASALDTLSHTKREKVLEEWKTLEVTLEAMIANSPFEIVQKKAKELLAQMKDESKIVDADKPIIDLTKFGELTAELKKYEAVVGACISPAKLKQLREQVDNAIADLSRKKEELDRNGVTGEEKAAALAATARDKAKGDFDKAVAELLPAIERLAPLVEKHFDFVVKGKDAVRQPASNEVKSEAAREMALYLLSHDLKSTLKTVKLVKADGSAPQTLAEIADSSEAISGKKVPLVQGSKKVDLSLFASRAIIGGGVHANGAELSGIDLEGIEEIDQLLAGTRPMGAELEKRTAKIDKVSGDLRAARVNYLVAQSNLEEAKVSLPKRKEEYATKIEILKSAAAKLKPCETANGPVIEENLKTVLAHPNVTENPNVGTQFHAISTALEEQEKVVRDPAVVAAQQVLKPKKETDSATTQPAKK